MDDPLLFLRNKTKNNGEYDLADAAAKFARFKITDLGKESLPLFSDNTEVDSEVIDQEKTPLQILQAKYKFDHQAPRFEICALNEKPSQIEWQISSSNKFSVTLPSLKSKVNYSSTIELDDLTQTHLNPNQTYYLRIRGSSNGIAGKWSETAEFICQKPAPVTYTEFNKVEPGKYEISWDLFAEESEDDPIEYLIFGSNSFDFIPSVYLDKQVYSISADETIFEENSNLISSTTDTKIMVDGSLAYYRIIAKKKGQLSIPSSIIHVYGSDLVQPRNVLQIMQNDSDFIVKRTLFKPAYSWTETALPRVGVVNRIYENSFLALHELINNEIAVSSEPVTAPTPYKQPTHVSDDLWKKMKPYFLPENHPWKSKVDRIFHKTRASQNSSTIIEAGFKGKITNVRKIFAGTHPDCKEIFFKIYTDSEVTSRYTEWQKWLDRIKGRNNVWRVIQKHKFEDTFSVPDKWVYPLPEVPAAPKASTRYKPKDFILVCSNEEIYSNFENEKLWMNKITPKMLDELYIVMDEAGMWDSVFIFNIPFSKKNGKICFVDTEYSLKWPVRFEKMYRYFSKENQKHWNKLINNHGPKGYKRPF